MKHPQVGDLVKIKFAGLTRVGQVTEISGSGLDKKWVVLAKGVFYPCLVLDNSSAHHIIEYIKDDIDTTRTRT
jgi:hypothetical protein